MHSGSDGVHGGSIAVHSGSDGVHGGSIAVPCGSDGVHGGSIAACIAGVMGYTGVGLPGGPRPAKRPSGQPEPYCGWPGWPAIIFHKC